MYNVFYCSRLTRVLSMCNCAKCLKFSDNKANTARWGIISISSISFECPLCSYNETVAQNNAEQSEFAWIIDYLSISSRKEEKYNYAVKFIAIVRMHDTKQISLFQFSIDVNGIIIWNQVPNYEKKLYGLNNATKYLLPLWEHFLTIYKPIN